MDTLAYLLLGILTDGAYEYLLGKSIFTGMSADTLFAKCEDLNFRARPWQVQRALDALIESGRVKAVPTSHGVFYCFRLPE
jgi:Fe2+ or Zn2+ uptake regulation protein